MLRTLLASALLAAAAGTAAAGPVTVSFKLSTTDAGWLYSGDFAGTDGNDDGVLSFGELTSFSATPTLNGSHYDLLPLTLSDLVGFGDFDIASDTWVPNGTSWPGSSDAAYFTWQDGEASFRADFTLVSTTVSSVPEPAALAMMGLGALALAGRRRRKTA